MMTCALLSAFQQRGLAPCAFKCGPDYIDPMFHRAVLGIESHNLDLFLSDENTVRTLYARYSAGHGAVLCEGVMGFYDGLGGTTTQASAWHVAEVLQLPVLLVVRPKGASLTVAAMVRGLRDFRIPNHLVGIVLNDCKPMLYRTLAPMLEKETGLPVLGYLPPMEEARFESRHLGLYTAQEVTNLKERIQALGQQAQKTVNLSALCKLCGAEISPGSRHSLPVTGRGRIAVARDEAFCFCYEETLDALKDAGAELAFFSPLHDSTLPQGCGGLYLPGGYPELYAEALSRNESMRAAIQTSVQAGLPTVAECGGFLYLGQALQDTNEIFWPMTAVLPGRGIRTEKLVRFGYANITAHEDSLLFRAGESVPVHEFHYWDCTQNGTACTASKPLGNRHWECGFAGTSLFASFAHLYMAGTPKLALRFVSAAERYERKQFACQIH